MTITNMNKPTVGSTGWGSNVNDNFTDVENFAKGTEAAQAIAVDNLKMDGNTLSSTDTNGNINVTPNGTGKVVLDGLNWPTADGSADQVIETDGSGNLSFATVSGGTGDLVLLETQTASASSTIDFTSNIDSTYKNYLFALIDMVPATDQVQFHMRVSTDGGSSWKSGSSDYTYRSEARDDSNSTANWGSTGENKIRILGHTGGFRIGNAAGEGISIDNLFMPNPAGTSIDQAFLIDTVYSLDNGEVARSSGHGRYQATTAVNGIRFFMSSGNISSGTFKLYGVK